MMPLRLCNTFLFFHGKQYSGSVRLRNGSGSSDSFLIIMDLDSALDVDTTPNFLTVPE
jgi:hypothetical protein